jgi:peptide subunit release factor 1 (eRF1)
MLPCDQIEQLERFDGGRALVLSVYLDLQPENRLTGAYRVEFDDLVRKTSDRLTKPEHDLSREAGRVPRDLWLADFQDLVPGKIDSGGARQSNVQRHHELRVLWHLKKVVEQLSMLRRRRNFDRLIIAGPVEPASERQQLLPHVLKSRVAAVIRADADVTNQQVLDKALEIERRIEADGEDRLVDEVIEMAGTGDRGTCGVGPTLEALWIGDVRVLLVADDVALEGNECSNCRYLQRGSAPTCPKCGVATHPVHDLGHRVASRASEQHGRVEIVHGRAAERPSRAGEGFEAFLRYPWPVGILESSGAEAVADRP